MMMGKMSEIHYDGSAFVSLSNDLRNYPEHYTAAHEAADRIDELNARVELLEGYLRGVLEVVERFVACDTKDARAALEGKDG
jgi:hypothetical protein